MTQFFGIQRVFLCSGISMNTVVDVQLFDGFGMLQMNYIHLLIRDSKKCLWKIHFHSSIPEHRQRVLFLKRIQWQRTLQPLA